MHQCAWGATCCATAASCNLQNTYALHLRCAAVRLPGGGAALWAAAYLDKRVSAVVVRGGRPDLAAEKLPAVSAPTLLLVGGDDTHVLDLNRAALRLLGSGPDSSLVVVPHAGHLFEGPGQLELVAEHAANWFAGHLGVST